MKKSVRIFREMAAATDKSATLASLPVKRWKKLYRYLLRYADGDGDEAAEEVLALMLIDAARRVVTGGKKS